MKQGQWLWYDNLYRVNIALLICPPEQFFKRADKLFRPQVAAKLRKFMGDEPPASLGVCLNLWIEGKQIVIVWAEPDANVGVIAHECLHATSYVMRSRGLKLSRKSEEAYTYHMEWVLNECLLRCAKKRTK